MKNESPEIKDERVERNKQILSSFFKEMSKSEKLFWGTIAVFLIIFIAISTLAYYNQSGEHAKKDLKTAILKDYIAQIVPSGTVRKNISENEENIFNDLNYGLKNIFAKTDEEMDALFLPIYNNIDNFLDYHYSIIGEYTELGAMAFGDIDALIADKLFGENFSAMRSNSSSNIQSEYKAAVTHHMQKLHEYAVANVDLELNIDGLKQLKSDVDAHIVLQEVKITAVGAVIGAKVATAISAKIATKAATKSAGKAGSKLAAKSVAAGTGAAAGGFCGPFFWICSPIAAGTLWFATDAVVVTGDEYITREKFKQEIIESLDWSKQELKNSYKAAYHKSFQELSQATMKEYRDASIVERKLVPIKDRF